MHAVEIDDIRNEAVIEIKENVRCIYRKIKKKGERIRDGEQQVDCGKGKTGRKMSERMRERECKTGFEISDL